MTEPIDVFISHHGKQGRSFYETFRDRFAEDNLTTKSHYDFGDAKGDERKTRMHDIIGSAKWFFFIATNKSCESEEALEEIRAAQALGIPIITLRAYEVTDLGKLPEELKEYRTVHVDDAPEIIREVIEDIVAKSQQKEESKPKPRQQEREKREQTQKAHDGAHAEQDDTLGKVLVAGLILGALLSLSRK